VGLPKFYVEVLKWLKKRVACIRPEIANTWVLHHDNAPSHASLLVREFLVKQTVASEFQVDVMGIFFKGIYLSYICGALKEQVHTFYSSVEQKPALHSFESNFKNTKQKDTKFDK
jgi:hypothetical protein